MEFKSDVSVDDNNHAMPVSDNNEQAIDSPPEQSKVSVVSEDNEQSKGVKNDEFDSIEEEEKEYQDKIDSNDIENISSRRSMRVKEVSVAKVPEKRAVKRKSISNSELSPKSKLPKYESVEVNLTTKTIYLSGDSSMYYTLDRVKLTTIPPKDGSFEVGDLIWAKIHGYPWWPCIITNDPVTGKYSKISGVSYKADRVYHIQYFGAQPYRGWTNIGMVIPFEGIDKFYEKINQETKDLPKKKMTKILAKYSVKPSFKKKWSESISEAEEAMKLDRADRVRKLTFNYIIGTEPKESKRKSDVSETSLVNQLEKNNSILSSKKSTTPEDVYDFEDDSDGFDNEPLPGFIFRKRCPKGDFQVYVRKHYDDELKSNPGLSKNAITKILKEKWDQLGEDIRCLYVERKAIYEDESNMFVSKRSHFGDDYFNDDSDYDYNDSDSEQNGFGKSFDHGDDKSDIFSESLNDSSALKPKRSKSKKSEKLFDKIKNDSSNISTDTPKRKSTVKKVSNSQNVSNKTPNKRETKDLNSSANRNSLTSKNENSKTKTKESNIDLLKKRLCINSEESSDETNNSDAASVDSGEFVKKPPEDMFCYQCGDEKKFGDELVSCDGVCRRHYHKTCINYEGDSAKFRCDECQSNKHKCFACQNPDDLETKKCEDNKCGRFYHLTCIENNYPIRVNESANSFLCPLHTCLNCHLLTLNDNEYRANNRKLVKCIYCPIAYHAKEICIGAGTVRVSKNYVICPEHYQTHNVKSKDRHINVNYCFACMKAGNLICCESCPAAFHEECLEYSFDHDKSFYCSDCLIHKQLHYGDIVWVKLGIYRWWPGRICHPNIVPENVLNLNHNMGDFPVYFFGSHDYYWVNKGRTFLFVEGDNQVLTSNSGSKSSGKLKNAFKLALQEASEAFEEWKKTLNEMSNSTITNKPPPYQHINSNRYLGIKNNSSNNESNVHTCDCKDKGTNSCADENCLNRISLIECDPKYCPAGELCKNQRFRKCEYVKCKPFKTKAAGWGLMTLEDIKEGQFVIEYCGEIIDEKECEKRLKKIASTQSNFYFLTLDKDNIIDAGPKGNLARFMNHSCDPNCVSQKWMVNNTTRIGLFALQDIPAGTELTFNYNLDCRGNEQIKCVCGSSKCSGYIGIRSKTEDNQNKRVTNGSKHKNGKSKNSKKKSSFNQLHEDVCFKCGEPGELIMCDQKGCPKSYHLACIDLPCVPKSDWFCPRHCCMKPLCKEPVYIFCSVCPNALCRTHASISNSLQLPDDQFLCEDHRSSDDEGLIETEANEMEK